VKKPKIQKALTSKNISVDPSSRPASEISCISDLRASSDKEPHHHNSSEITSTVTTEREDTSSVVSFSNFPSNGVRPKTVGILIIGGEILKGAKTDTNSQIAAKVLRENCVLLKRVVMVSDSQDEIMKEISAMEEEVDVIITSGGVGPTHDDITMKSVAAALGRDMVFHEEMAELLKEKMNGGGESELSEVQTKMAKLPSRSKLRYLSNNKDDWPVLQCRNIFLLPGVPELFAKKIKSIATYLSLKLERSDVYKVVLSVDESSIVKPLNQAVSDHPLVTFGSYPFVNHPALKTVLTLEGKRVIGEKHIIDNQEVFSKKEMDTHVLAALDDLLAKLPKGSILRVEDNDDLEF